MRFAVVAREVADVDVRLSVKMGVQDRLEIRHRADSIQRLGSRTVCPDPDSEQRAHLTRAHHDRPLECPMPWIASAAPAMMAEAPDVPPNDES